MVKVRKVQSVVIPVVNYSISLEADTRVVRQRSASQGVNPDKSDTPPPPPNSEDSAEIVQSSLESALAKKEEVIDLVAKVNDDTDKELMMMDLSAQNLATDELSKDSEGFAKCRTHKNKDGLVVLDTPTHEDQVIVVEDDLGPSPDIYLESPDEERVANREVTAARVGPSAPATLVAGCPNC